MAEILQREPDYKLYVDIQKIYAQMVVKIQDTIFIHLCRWRGRIPTGTRCG